MELKTNRNFKTANLLVLLGAASAPLVHAAAGTKVPAVAAKAPAKAISELAAESPNIVIIMLDDAGFSDSSTFGGEVNTPTLSRIANSGISYNAFHTTAVSSATRAALLTGRNHHRAGFGAVAEMAVPSHEGYAGVIPPSTATIPQVLKQKGYVSAAFGKWHNTPIPETGPRGPFNHWPTAYGFDHFFGFLGGETDQYQPSLFLNTKAVEPPRSPRYHFTEDLGDRAAQWIEQQHKQDPKKPFFLYWAPGGVHSPHQVFPAWSAKYKGKFDMGWDSLRQRNFERQKSMGWIPQDTVNTPRPAEMPAWDSLTAEEKQFHARSMEIYAGFLEHTDTQAGKVIDQLERLGLRNNTLVFYVFSDNGASSEGMQGTVNGLVGLNGIVKTTQDSIQALNKYHGGLSALGGINIEGHYASPWAWAGEAPLAGTKLLAGHFGGTRTPLTVSWPAKIPRSTVVRSQFHHVNDIAPTIYDVVGIQPPQTLNSAPQAPLDGVSLSYTFSNAKVTSSKPPQYFEFLGSRGQYADGWMASALGPRKPWVADLSGLLKWSGKASYLLRTPWFGTTFGWLKWKPEDDVWELYDLKNDYSQAKDVSAQHPEKLAELKRQFEQAAQSNHVYPIGTTFSTIFNPEKPTQTEWHFGADYNRQPELATPNIKSRNNVVTVDADFPARANGVLFSLGGSSSGIALFVKDGVLSYDYNAFSFERMQIRAPQALPAGRAKVSVELKMDFSIKQGGPATAILRVNDKEVGRGSIPLTAPRFMTGTGTFGVGQNLGGAVSPEYAQLAPFAFTGKIHDVHVQYK